MELDRDKSENLFLPIVNGKDCNENVVEPKDDSYTEKTPCPCCGYVTIPKKWGGMCFICPICFWEIDPFISSKNEPSDFNHQLTLEIAQKNYAKYGAVLKDLTKYTRKPKDYEISD